MRLAPRGGTAPDAYGLTLGDDMRVRCPHLLRSIAEEDKALGTVPVEEILAFLAGRAATIPPAHEWPPLVGPSRQQSHRGVPPLRQRSARRRSSLGGPDGPSVSDGRRRILRHPVLETPPRDRLWEALVATATDLRRPLSLSVLLRRVLRRMRRALAFTQAWAYVEYPNTPPLLVHDGSASLRPLGPGDLQLLVTVPGVAVREALVTSYIGGTGLATVSGPVHRVIVCLAEEGSPAAALVFQRQERRALETEERRFLEVLGTQLTMVVRHARLFQELREQERHRVALLRQQVVAQEAERKRIARELHDELGQTLCTLATAVGALAQDLEQGRGTKVHEVPERLGDVGSLVHQGLTELRRIVQDLRPSVLDDLGFVLALHWLVERTLTSAGVVVEVSVTGLERPLAPILETTLFRIAQEAVHNIVKHAGATRAWLTLHGRGRSIVLTIEDDGRGLEARDPVPASRRNGPLSGGFGLVGIRERVSLYGGSFSLASHPGQGTRLSVSLPLVG